jgi:hypothetical protein
LASLSAVATATNIPQIARAASADFRIDGEYAYPRIGLVRSVRFYRSGDRPEVQILFASLLRNVTRAQIVQGSEMEIRGSQLWHLADKHNAIIGVNGGFFQGNSFAYDGLLVVGGHQLSPKNTQFTGAAVADADGRVSIEHVDDVKDPFSAMQSGPLFIEPGGRMGMRSHTYDLFRRSFIAQNTDTIVAGITSPVSLYQLAELLMEYPSPFLLDRFDVALSLCGAATAAFFARTGKSDIRDGGAVNSPAVILFP